MDAARIAGMEDGELIEGVSEERRGGGWRDGRWVGGGGGGGGDLP